MSDKNDTVKNMEQADERVSFRMGKDEMGDIESFIKTQEYTNKSEFFRCAARAQMRTHHERNTVSVEVAPLLLEYIDKLVGRGFFLTKEDAIKEAINSYFTEERKNQCLREADGMEVAVGKKFKVDIDDTPKPRIVSR